jgi:hypothetical protein
VKAWQGLACQDLGISEREPQPKVHEKIDGVAGPSGEDAHSGPSRGSAESSGCRGLQPMDRQVIPRLHEDQGELYIHLEPGQHAQRACHHPHHPVLDQFQLLSTQVHSKGRVLVVRSQGHPEGAREQQLASTHQQRASAWVELQAFDVGSRERLAL